MDHLPGYDESASAPGSPGNPMHILMVLPPKDFNDDEYSICRSVFDSASSRAVAAGVVPGLSLVPKICSSHAGRIRGSFGTWVEVDCMVHEVDIAMCAAVVFIGGVGVPAYFESRSVIRLASDAAAAGLVVGAICAAPGILARAGLLEMCAATSHPGTRPELERHGAVFVDEPVVVSGRLVTAVGPVAADRFAREILRIAVGGSRGAA